MIVYVVTSGTYSAYSIEAIYADQAEAEAHRALIGEANVEEYELREKAPTPVRIFEKRLLWRTQISDSPEMLAARDAYRRAEHALALISSPVRTIGSVYRVTAARDVAQAEIDRLIAEGKATIRTGFWDEDEQTYTRAGDDGEAEWFANTYDERSYSGGLRVIVRGTDHSRVVKVFGEMKAQAMAEREGIA